MTATMAEISEEVAVNPDAQSAVTDFLDYTEYLPTDLIRSLALIQQLDETYLTNADSIHALTQTYGNLPSLPISERPDTSRLRSTISRHLDLAISARESAFAEALRLFDLTDRHQGRLKSIIAKLNALPKPPSRDPTPQPQAQNSVKRSRSGRKLEIGTAPRLTLKPPKGTIASTILPRPRHKRVTVPGEVLPPYDPDEPIASTEVSDWDSDVPSPTKPVAAPVPQKPPRQRPAADPERKPREPRETTSYRKPTPPPDDAPIGSKWRPWTHLSEYEMYKLRKKMKKNHTWEPSDVMIRRELAEKGRGWDNYYKARAAAQTSGSPFIDIENAEKPSAPPPPAKTEVPKPTPKTEVPSRPKSLKRTDSKKDKREDPKKDPASIAAQQTELAARNLGDFGSTIRNLFSLTSPFSTALASLKTATTTPPATAPIKLDNKPPKKRKLDDAKSATPSSEPEGQPKKKQKILPKPSPLAAPEQNGLVAQSIGTIKLPSLKLNVSAQPSAASATPTPASTSRPVSATKVPSTVTKSEATPPPPPAVSSRPPSRRSAAASVEPSILSSARPSRGASATPAAPIHKPSATETTPKQTTFTAASRRSKREAPGTVTQSSQDGGAAVSVSKRAHKPNKGSKAQGQKAVTDVKPEIRTDVDGYQELVDPDEERYCVCGDVSWGNMICCELEEKCEYGQWFHMDCVSLPDLLPRTVKWYCPGDRKKLHKGEHSNGLIGRGIK